MVFEKPEKLFLRGKTFEKAVSRDDATAQRLKPGKEKEDFVASSRRCVRPGF
jgi:hypothetical protein